MTHYDPLRLTEDEIDRLLGEDAGTGDLTTRVSGIGGKPGAITYHARDALILSGIDEAARIFERLGAEVVFRARAGLDADPGTLLLEARGGAGALHAGWKISQIVMEWASGVALATARIVRAATAVAPDIRVACTRKSVPFTKKLSVKAVLAGGGEVHRLGLAESVMLFAEHRQFFDDPRDLAAIIATVRRHAPEQAVMIEVATVEEALAAAKAFADVIQLEKFSPDEIHQVVSGISRRPDGRPVIAAAGGINPGNAAGYAASGADVLVTSSPYYARPADIQVRFQTG